MNTANNSQSVPAHVATASADAKGQRLVELPELDAVAYVDKRSGDLALAARSPEALKKLLDRSRPPDAVVLNDKVPASNLMYFSNEGGHAAELARMPLERLGVAPEKIDKVVALLAVQQRDKAALDPGVRLESLGKGVSTADVDEKTNQVVIRRSGRVIERFADDKAIAEFAETKKLSEVDRETLARLSELRQVEPSVRAEAKRSLGPDAKAREPELVNIIEPDPDKARLRAEVRQNDAETYAWVERQRKLREQQRVQPVDAAPIAAATAAAPPAALAKPESKGVDTIEKESTFSSPNPRRAVPPEVGSQYLQVGEKYYNPNNTRTVAFVDRGDKLETPSSAPKTAEALVKIAEARGWEDLRVKGTEGFRREVWLEASVRGIHVDGYKPSEMDKAELERRDTFVRDQNSVEVRSEAFQKLSPEEGTRRDPSLVNAYAVIQAAKAFAKERIPDKAQQSAFVESTQAKVVADLEAGRTTPTVNIRTAAPNREAEQSRDLDLRRDRER